MASDTTFPQVLHTILEDVDPSIISWVSGGTAFAVHDKTAFERILPNYLKSSKWKTFQRSINLWDFTTIRKGNNKGYISHPLFRQGQRDLARQMKRIRIKGNGDNKGGIPLELLKDKKALAAALVDPTGRHHHHQYGPNMASGAGSTSMNGINSAALLAMNQNPALNMMMMMQQPLQQQQHQHHQQQQQQNQGYMGQIGQSPQNNPAAMQQVLLQIQMQQQMMLMQQQLVMQQMVGANSSAAGGGGTTNVMTLHSGESNTNGGYMLGSGLNKPEEV